MKISWAEQAWEDYLYWQKTDKAILQRINRIIRETKRNPFEGIGGPDPGHHGPEVALTKNCWRAGRTTSYTVITL